MKYLGLRREGDQCKAALLSYKKRAIQIHELTSFPSIEALNERKGKYRLVCALDERDVLIKRVNTPNNSLRILKRTLPFQIDAHFEVKSESFLFHPFTCFTDITFVAAAPKNRVDQIIDQYDPSCISTEQAALLRFANEYAEEYHSLCIVFIKRDQLICVTLEKGSYGRSATFPIDDHQALVEDILSLMPTKRKLPLLFLGSGRYRKNLIEEFDKKEESFQVVSLSLPDAHLEYALEIGLALEGAAPKQMSVQFRKGKRTPKEEKKRFKRARGFVITCSLLLAGICQIAFEEYYEKMARSMNNNIDELIGNFPELYADVPNGWNVVERMDSLKAIHQAIPQEKRFTAPFHGFSGVYGRASELATQYGLEFHKVEYHLSTYPTVKKPKEKYSGELRLYVRADDPKEVKEFCEALTQAAPFHNGKGIEIRRDANGFTITSSFVE